MNLFRGLIKCKSCGKNYNFKAQRGTEVFICQTRKNYGSKFCDSKTIKLEEILNMIKRHCKIVGIEFDEINCENLISKMLVDENGNFIVYYKDGSEGKYENSKIIF